MPEALREFRALLAEQSKDGDRYKYVGGQIRDSRKDDRVVGSYSSHPGKPVPTSLPVKTE